MKKTPLIIVAVVAVVVVLGGIIFASSNMDSNDSMSDSMPSSGMNSELANSDATAMAPADAVETNEVSIEDYKFGPENIKVKVGTTVTWTNNDSVRHNVAGINNDLPEGDLIARGESYSYTFMKAGIYNYLCTPHPYMKASVTVVE